MDAHIKAILFLCGLIVTLAGAIFRAWVKSHEEKVDAVCAKAKLNNDDIQDLKQIAAAQGVINKEQVKTNARLETLILKGLK